MNEIIEDLVKIYLSCIDCYTPKVKQTLNDKYTLIDKAMLTAYMFVKIIEDRNEKNEEVTKVLKNYLLRQVIYSETGNIVFEIEDKEKTNLYNEILDSLVLEKFKYKNRILRKLKYDYNINLLNTSGKKYTELLVFLENIAEYFIFKKMALKGNIEAKYEIDKIKEKIGIFTNNTDRKDYFYKEKKEILELISKDELVKSQYGNLSRSSFKFKRCI